MDEKITLELTPDQLRTLIHSIYLSGWMINGIRVHDERVARYDELEQLIYAYGKKVGMEDMVQYLKEEKRFGYKGEYQEDNEANTYRSAYDDEVFWGELIQRLTTRDMFESSDPESFAELTAQQEAQKRQPFLRKYIDEFEERGVQRLRIQEA